ncbi:class I SAM-dependent methyltransferase [Streptomyces sp. MP131-18]|uniref:class I SAM-dependent methyltransferase n=1 Tax=Streptomyces sp. MP131-18 TaxID=1857892 RepID=UPI00097CAF68|nr:class I SAM-dependent methyltransferase [Streptomyces sp. MP131-18]ONK14866.1 3-demethylubiquinone-9 3-methyltransferase [Streptomyces sp. MP131-18]
MSTQISESAQTSEPESPYASSSQYYDASEVWACRYWQEAPRLQKASFIQSLWEERDAPVHKVLDLCCGTGLLLRDLTQRGYTVTGLDRSAAMLEQAAHKLGSQAEGRLVLGELPDIPLQEEFDAVYSTGGALNYLPNDTSLLRSFESVYRVLRPGGTFVFDLYTDALMEHHVEQTTLSVRAIELGEGCTMLYRCERPARESHFYDVTFAHYVRDDATQRYTRTGEAHRMFTRTAEKVRSLVAQAGFGDIKTFDNYQRQPIGSQTFHETYAVVKNSHSARSTSA